MAHTPQSVLDFWFSTETRPRWFARDTAFDMEIQTRFGAMVQTALHGGYSAWENNAPGSLALLILLDQLTRNIHRGTAQAFAGDPRARAVAAHALAQSFDQQMPLVQRIFFYLPFEHSEDSADQTRSVQLFTRLRDQAAPAELDEAENYLHYAQAHADVIARFGRFPHRNAALARNTTPDEAEFLTRPGSSF